LLTGGAALFFIAICFWVAQRYFSLQFALDGAALFFIAICFWVAQRFSAAISGQAERGFSP